MHNILLSLLLSFEILQKSKLWVPISPSQSDIALFTESFFWSIRSKAITESLKSHGAPRFLALEQNFFDDSSLLVYAVWGCDRVCVYLLVLSTGTKIYYNFSTCAFLAKSTQCHYKPRVCRIQTVSIITSWCEET